jgi:hypothetical protein
MKLPNLKRLIAVVLIWSHLLPALANAQAPNPNQTGAKKSGPRKQAATIIFAGLGGAVLGLSTLSFYGRPQDKLSNIAIGAAVGVIIGTVYVTYRAATTPSEFYGDTSRVVPSNPHQVSVTPSDLIMAYNFEF